MPKIKSEPSKTLLTISTGLLVFYFIKNNIWLLRSAALVGIIGVASDVLSLKIEYLWHKLAWLLGKIVPNIILSLIFFLFIFPLSVLRRMFGGKDLLMLNNSMNSTYTNGKKEFSPRSFEKIW